MKYKSCTDSGLSILLSAAGLCDHPPLQSAVSLMHPTFLPPSWPPLAAGGYKQPKNLDHRDDDDDGDDDAMLCKTVVTKDRRYITQITCYEKGSENRKHQLQSGNRKQGASRPLTYGKLEITAGHSHCMVV